MRKLLVFPLLVVLAGPLGGCAGVAETALGLPSGVLTQSTTNPITRDTLLRLENGLIIGVGALKTYKELCNNGTLAESCIDVVVKMQGYVKKARPLLKSLRTFVRKNDQVNARVVYENVQGLIAEFRATAAANNIPIPATVGVP